MNPALDGLNVLELGAGSMPASITGMLLADNGARVTKVEPPEGDRMRTLFPTGFLVWNRGKESLIADLRTTEGLGAVTEWARSADVVIEGLATGRLERWGLSLSALRTQCPRLVTCSISGFGPRSIYSKLKSYEGVVAAKCGFYNRGDFGFRRGPIFAAPALASSGAAQMAFSGILAALYLREESGRGQHIEASMFAGLTPLDYFSTTHFQLAARANATRSATAYTSVFASLLMEYSRTSSTVRSFKDAERRSRTIKSDPYSLRRPRPPPPPACPPRPPRP